MTGMASIKSFPNIEKYTNFWKIPDKSHPDELHVFNCYPEERNQLIAAGRNHVLEYMYLWDDDLKMEGSSPVCVVRTNDKKEVQSGVHNELPHKRMMTVSIIVNGISVDGFVEIRRNNVIVRKQIIKSDGRNDVEELNYGDCVQIYSGLDKIWECTFVRKRMFADDDALYQKLVRCHGATVDIPHAIGALAVRLQDHPKTLQWLKRCIREGKIVSASLRILINSIGDK